MKNIQTITDKTAISLSLLCAIHCLGMPLLIILLPQISTLAIGDEAFHLWMLVVVIPISLFALTMGCQKHRTYRVFLVGFIGLAILIFAATLGHDLLGEIGEQLATVVGAAVITVGHLWNHKLCQHERCQRVA